MTLRRAAARALRAGLGVAVVAAACLACSDGRHGVPSAPAAHPVSPEAAVGAVFLGGDDAHMCSAAALAAGAGDLILTAAHCLAAGTDAVFVPGFGGGDTRGGWHVDDVYLDPRWSAGQDPVADYAIARVSRPDGVRLHAVTGPGLQLGAAPRLGQEVTVVGYPAGSGGPLACRAPTLVARQGFPALRCDGVVDGFSGAPWISGVSVTGLVGGLDGGGCADELSYSPPFDGAVAALLTRAEAGGPGDAPPAMFDDGCV